MTENNLTITNLHDLLDHDARRFTSAEIQLKYILNEWIARAGSVKLKMVLQKYVDLVQQHVQKLEGFLKQSKLVR